MINECLLRYVIRPRDVRPFAKTEGSNNTNVSRSAYLHRKQNRLIVEQYLFMCALMTSFNLGSDPTMYQERKKAGFFGHAVYP